jgi:hypothetical protein
MSRRPLVLAAALAAALVLGERWAVAGEPTALDCVTANEAATKLVNGHKLRAARSELLRCAAASCPADIRKECLGRVDRTNAQIPTIAFAAKDTKGADLAAVTVTMDGEVVAERLDGTAIAIDPGEHTFTFETAGQPSVTKKLVIIEGQKERREAITFGSPSTPAAPTPAPGPAAATGIGPSTAPSDAGGEGGLGTQKVLAVVAAGLGVVGLGVGAVFGAMALSKKSDAQNACPSSGGCPTQDGSSKWSDATSTGNISTVALIVGTVGIAAGAVVWLTAPSTTGVRVGLGPASLQLKGTW